MVKQLEKSEDYYEEQGMVGNIFWLEIPKDIEFKCGISYICELVGYDNGGRCNVCAKNPRNINKNAKIEEINKCSVQKCSKRQ